MSDQQRAHAIVEAFRADGHPYYDELLAPIEAALEDVRLRERRVIVSYVRARLRHPTGTDARATVADALDRIERGLVGP